MIGDNNMKKHLIVIGTAVLLLVVGLSGCNSIVNQFEGTWTGHKEMQQFEVIYIIELTFTSSSVYMTFQDVYNASAHTVSGNYETEGNQLLMQFPTGYSLSYQYEFKDNALYLDGSKFVKQ